jgi:hypothetical protein
MNHPPDTNPYGRARTDGAAYKTSVRGIELLGNAIRLFVELSLLATIKPGLATDQLHPAAVV